MLWTRTSRGLKSFQTGERFTDFAALRFAEILNAARQVDYDQPGRRKKNISLARLRPAENF